ncbi:MAG: Fibronectin type domain protein [Pedosphaera sp.]|nr:Fibronectin type domain protein [Pedosphaera sp.]
MAGGARRGFWQLLIWLLIGFVSLSHSSARAVEGTWQYAVQVSATVQSAPPQITLSWAQDVIIDPPISYTVYRKPQMGTNWGTGTLLAGTTTSYVDNNVTNGGAYEYQIVRQTSLYNGYGYIYAGLNAPLTEWRGKVLLVVDNTYATNLSSELTRLQQDLVGDGWTVLRQDVARTQSVASVKALIQAQYTADTNNVKAVFLFGHVPVPYSGDIVPDGHEPDHHGAWPADLYYGDMTGVWTDTSVNDTRAGLGRNQNIPGDGKFDQSTIPVPVKLMVGRVDLANLPGQLAYDSPPTFTSELELLRNYLNKDHNFRFKLIDLPRRGLVGDYVGVRNGEAVAASGWRNFAPFFGATNITSLPNQGTWIPTLATNGYLWAYACGSGDWNALNGIGNQGMYFTGTSTELVGTDIRAAFVLFFGSWFGDWDSQDNLMRSVLATPTYGLACGWSGSPHWFCHHMGLGEPIGYSARLTQNNGTNGLYQNESNNAAGLVHVALMGDPTLRMHVVGPAANLARHAYSGGISLSWSASPEAVAGYYVYRATYAGGPFARLNDSLVGSTNYTDASVAAGTYVYMVRAVKLESTPSGSYTNASQGIFTTETVGYMSPPTVVVAATTPTADARNGTPGVFTFSRSDTNGDLAVHYALSGIASTGSDYVTSPDNGTGSVVIAAGVVSASLTITPLTFHPVGTKTVLVSLAGNPAYLVGSPASDTVTITGNSVAQASIQTGPAGVTLQWPSMAGSVYHVAYKNQLTDPYWTDFGSDIYATEPVISWLDGSSGGVPQRFYTIFEVR